jgi:FAD/FMN-containing dehydrogenase
MHTTPQPSEPPEPTRRTFLRTSAMLGLTAWLPKFRVLPASSMANTDCPSPPNFPAGINVFQQAYSNWSGEISIDALWTATASTPQDVVTLANWAYSNGWRLRPRGMAHNWAPISVDPDANCNSPTLMLDTTAHLTAVSIDLSMSPPTVTAQTGVAMEVLHNALQDAGLGMTNCPAPGAISLGGVLTVNGHGTSVPAIGETTLPGHTFGTLSNMLRSVTAVVWDVEQQAYTLRTFQRSEPEMAALCVHLGRAFLVEVTMQVGANARVRCESFRNRTASELFAPPESPGQSYSSFMDASGRVETILYPFTDSPWLKVWTPTPAKPLLSRQVSAPFNYPFSDNIPLQVSQFVSQIVSGAAALTPAFGATMATVTDIGLTTNIARDLWGWSKDVQLYIKPTTLRVAECGFALSCRRSDVQRALSEFHQKYTAMQQEYRDRGEYPMNCPVEIRVSSVDHPEDCLVPGAQVALLSAARPWPSKPQWDCVVWFNILSIPGTPGAPRYYAELEEWFYSNYGGDYAGVRVEWSKGWAYTDDGAYTNDLTIAWRIPESFTQGMPADANFRTAVDILDRLDPARIFSTKLLDRLMPRTPDLTGDGVVDTADLSDMLTSWGPGSPPADLIINQEVGGEDMGQLLMHWGPLPL